MASTKRYPSISIRRVVADRLAKYLRAHGGTSTAFVEGIIEERTPPLNEEQLAMIEIRGREEDAARQERRARAAWKNR